MLQCVKVSRGIVDQYDRKDARLQKKIHQNSLKQLLIKTFFESTFHTLQLECHAFVSVKDEIPMQAWHMKLGVPFQLDLTQSLAGSTHSG